MVHDVWSSVLFLGWLVVLAHQLFAKDCLCQIVAQAFGQRSASDGFDFTSASIDASADLASEQSSNAESCHRFDGLWIFHDGSTKVMIVANALRAIDDILKKHAHKLSQSIQSQHIAQHKAH